METVRSEGSDMIQLRGITWDHVRGIAPLLATSEEFRRLHPQVSIVWDKRSLKDFEDYPVDVLAEQYDLIMLDHPSIGASVRQGVILPLDKWMPDEFLREQMANSVGPSYASYTWEGHQWALAVDAAAQVSAFRADLLERSGAALPRTWSEVFQLAAALPKELAVAVPLHPTHAFCSFFTLCANLGGNDVWETERAFGAAEEALATLQTLSQVIHPVSLEMDPIQMLDRMAETDEIAYVPLLFGYSNYSREGFRKHIVAFADIPSFHSEPSGGTIGGVGIAISAKCRNIRTAVDYAMFVADANAQRGTYFSSGGQPGHRLAWTDEEVNRQSHGFFANTLRTLDLASMRPRSEGAILLQEKAGELIHSYLRSGGERKEVVRTIHQWFRELRSSV